MDLVTIAQRSRPCKSAPLCAPPPPKKAHCFRIFSTKHFCNAPTSSFHHNLILMDLAALAERCRPSKCARLSGPKKGPTVSDSSQPGIFVIPQTVASAEIFFCRFAHSSSEI